MYAFVRVSESGEPLFGTLTLDADDEEQLIPENERRSLSAALDLDPAILGVTGTIH